MQAHCSLGGLLRHSATAQAACLPRLSGCSTLAELRCAGDYTIETTAFWSERVYSHVFRLLNEYHVQLDAILLKPNMVLPGADFPQAVSQFPGRRVNCQPPVPRTPGERSGGSPPIETRLKHLVAGTSTRSLLTDERCLVLPVRPGCAVGVAGGGGQVHRAYLHAHGAARSARHPLPQVPNINTRSSSVR